MASFKVQLGYGVLPISTSNNMHQCLNPMSNMSLLSTHQAPAVRLLRNWWPSETRGTWYSLSSTAAGTFSSITGLVCIELANMYAVSITTIDATLPKLMHCAATICSYGWRHSVIAAATVAAFCSIASLLLILLPSHFGPVAIQHPKPASAVPTPVPAQQQQQQQGVPFVSSVAHKFVLIFRDRHLCKLAFLTFCVYLIRSGLTDWYVLELQCTW
jgi:sugar phosphate permease